MQEPTVPAPSQVANRADRAIRAAQLLHDHGQVTVSDLEALWSEVDAIRDDLDRL